MNMSEQARKQRHRNDFNLGEVQTFFANKNVRTILKEVERFSIAFITLKHLSAEAVVTGIVKYKRNNLQYS